jgi:hypothetical protein
MKRPGVMILLVVFAFLAIADTIYDFVANDTVRFYSEQPRRLLVVAGIGVLGGLMTMLWSRLGSRLWQGMGRLALRCGIQLPLSLKGEIHISISRRAAIIGALLSLFVLGNGRFALMLHEREPWLLPPVQDFWLTVMGVGSVYLMRVGASQLAILVASVFVACSPFARPYRLFGSIVAAWSLMPLLFWMVKSPHWELFSSSAPAVALVIEILSALVLTGTALLMLWATRRLAGVGRKPTNLASHQTDI